MIIVIVNHFALFANPLTVLAGGGRLWVGAAELFFLISGITFSIVRMPAMKKRFNEVVKKSFKRAAQLYLINIFTVIASLGIAFTLLSHSRLVNIPGDLPSNGVIHTAWQILSMQYGYGWADFLMYYSVILLLAPFALRALLSRAWLIVPLASAALFGLSAVQGVHANAYLYFIIWQFYFFAGLTIGRFRLNILSSFNQLNTRVKYVLGYSTVTAGLLLLVAGLMAGYPQRISAAPLPSLIKSFSLSLSGSSSVNYWLGNNRTGLARPLVSLVALAMLYVIYQRYKQVILNRTGNFVMSFGRNSLEVFVLQALVIPLVSALPLRRNSMILNTGLTGALVFSMWLLTHKISPLPAITSAFQSFYASIINITYIALSAARNLRSRLFAPELD